MTTEARTAEQQNEHEAKVMLADALNRLRNNLWTANRDLEDALGVLKGVEDAIKAIPDGIDADSIDVAEVVDALGLAVCEDLHNVCVRSIQDDINRAAGNLSEAVGQVDYLEAGDFSE